MSDGAAGMSGLSGVPGAPDASGSPNTPGSTDAPGSPNTRGSTDARGATDVTTATDATDTPDALGAADITDTPEVIGATGISSVSGGPHRRWIAVLVCGVLPAALIAAMVAVSAALGSRLPEGGSFVGLMIAILGVGIVRLGWDAVATLLAQDGLPGHGLADGAAGTSIRRR